MNFLRKNQVNISRFTSIQIGGMVDSVFFPQNSQGVQEVFREIEKEELKFFILGGGSNVVIQDGTLDYAAIFTSNLTHYRFIDNQVFVEAGMNISSLAELAANKDLSGLEFAYGLPGTIGGAVLMNARAYGGEIGELIEYVEVYDYEKKEFITVSSEECKFAYKQSIFQEKPYMIYKVLLNLKKSEEKTIWKLMDKYRFDRSEKGHYLKPSAGCTFKNNQLLNEPSGKIIDDLGLKGFQIGGVKVSEKHGNFLVNNGGASYQDYMDMVDYIKEKVKSQKDVNLECEVKFLP